MARIFVSYRREDDSGHAGRLYDRLAAHFGEEHVFMDVDSLEPGVDFVETIETTVGAVDAFIAVIGPDWLTCTDSVGNRRLDDPHDFVRLELGNALTRGIRVIPVLVRGADMPREHDLPDNLKTLVRRNALIMSDTEWHASVLRLVESLDGALGAASPARQPAGEAEAVDDAADTRRAERRRPSNNRRFVLGSVLALVLVLMLAIVFAIIAAQGGAPENIAASVETTIVTQPGLTERVTVTDERETQPVETAPLEGPRLAVADARALQDTSTAEMQRGNYARALAFAAQALPALEGRDPRYEAYASFNIGNSLAHLGRCSEALPYLDRRERLLGAHPAVTSARRLCGA